MTGGPRHLYVQRHGARTWTRRALGFNALILLGGCSSIGRSPDRPAPPSPTPPAVTPIFTPAPATPTATLAPTVEPSPTPVPPPAAQDLTASLLRNEAGVYGVVVLDADESPIVSWNSTTPFITASLYKLILIADIYRKIETGEVHPDWLVVLQPDVFDSMGDMYFGFEEIGAPFPVRELLFAAGAYSSNAAARSLLIYSSGESMRDTAVAIGMESTYFFVDPKELPFWPPEPADDAPPGDVETARAYLEASFAYGPVNLTTPLDMARYQLALVDGTLISPWVSEQIVAILEEQLIRDRIPLVVPTETRVFNKPGNLVDAVHDVGVIYLPEGPRAIALLSQAVPDDERATLVLQRLAMIAAGETNIPPLPDDTGG